MPPPLITSLAPTEVFIFGSNSTGFHGAGGAGLACRGEARNTWRTDPWFLKAMASPVGSPDRVGLWAVYGVARGWQKGREGMSYAVMTVTRPGARRSVPLAEITTQLRDLVAFAILHPYWRFLMTPIGAGLAGYSGAEMLGALGAALGGEAPPGNLVVPADLYA